VIDQLFLTVFDGLAQFTTREKELKMDSADWHTLLEPTHSEDLDSASAFDAQVILDGLGSYPYLDRKPDYDEGVSSPFAPSSPNAIDDHDHDLGHPAVVSTEVESPILKRESKVTSAQHHRRRGIIAPSEHTLAKRLGLTVDKVESMQFSELSSLAMSKGMSAEDFKKIKSLRKRLKNRKTAHVSSVRKRTHAESLEETNDKLKARLNQLEDDNMRLRVSEGRARARAASESERVKQLEEELSQLKSRLFEPLEDLSQIDLTHLLQDPVRSVSPKSARQLLGPAVPGLVEPRNPIF